MTHYPNIEMAATAWVKTIPAIDPTKVATTVPGDPTGWADTGFVQVMAVGGSPAVHTPMRSPTVSVSAWAVSPGSQKTPWGKAQALAETVFNAFYDPHLFPFVAVFSPLDYLPAIVRTGYPLSEPRKIPGNDAGYGQVQFDAMFTWTIKAGA